MSNTGSDNLPPDPFDLWAHGETASLREYTHAHPIDETAAAYLRDLDRRARIATYPMYGRP